MIAALDALLPEREGRAPAIDWPAAVEALGTNVPSDYRAFCDRWDHVRIDDDVNVEAPSGNGRTGLVGLVSWKLEVDRDSVAEGVWQGAVWPERDGLLPWGWTEDGTTLLWRTRGEPDEWTVVTRRDAEEEDDWGTTVATGLRTCEFLAERLERSPRPRPLKLHVFGDERSLWVPTGIPDACDMGVEDLPDRWRLLLNLGQVLGTPRRVALDGFLRALAESNPKAHAAILESSARHSREVIDVVGGWRGRRRVEQVRDAAIAWCGERV